MRKAFLLTVIVAFTIIAGVKAQSTYKTALGVKFYPGAFTIKHFVSPHGAIEGLASFWKYGSRITGLYEYHMPIRNAPGLQWYAGGGAHLSFYNDKHNQNGSSGAGLDGVIGLDYKIKDAPINFSLDWNPTVEFGDSGPYDDGHYYGWVGFAIRFVIN